MTFSSILTPLAIVAGSAVGAFVIAVLLDDIAGILLALRKGRFDWNQLPSFMESEFGTQKAAALLGLVVAAVTSAAGAALVHGGLTSAALQGVADAAFAAATAGAGAMMLSVLSDLFTKVGQIFGTPVPAPEGLGTSTLPAQKPSA